MVLIMLSLWHAVHSGDASLQLCSQLHHYDYYSCNKLHLSAVMQSSTLLHW